MEKEKKKNLIQAIKLFFVGIVSGVVNGFFGAGGGLIIVPMLKQLKMANSKVVHATTLGCVLFMCTASSVVYFLEGIIDFKLVLFCLIGSLIGSFFATKLLKKLKNVYIDLIFSFVLIIAGVTLFIF